MVWNEADALAGETSKRAKKQLLKTREKLFRGAPHYPYDDPIEDLKAFVGQLEEFKEWANPKPVPETKLVPEIKPLPEIEPLPEDNPRIPRFEVNGIVCTGIMPPFDAQAHVKVAIAKRLAGVTEDKFKDDPNTKPGFIPDTPSFSSLFCFNTPAYKVWRKKSHLKASRIMFNPKPQKSRDPAYYGVECKMAFTRVNPDLWRPPPPPKVIHADIPSEDEKVDATGGKEDAAVQAEVSQE